MDLAVWARFIQIAGAAFVLGGLFLSHSGNDTPPPVKRLAAAGGGLGAALVALGVLLTLQIEWQNGPLVPATRTAGLLLYTMLIRGIMAILLAISIFAGAPRPVQYAAGAVIVLTLGVSDHSLTGDVLWLTVPAQSIHNTGAAAWVGFLVMAALTGLVHDPHSPWFRNLIQRFISFTGVVGVILLATGTGAAILRLRTPYNLTETPYGETLIVKIWLVGAAALFTIILRYLIMPVMGKADPDLLVMTRLGIATGALLGLGVLLGGALLGAAQLPPPYLQRHEIIMGDYYFDPSYIEVNVGEAVRIVPRNEGNVIHDMVIKDLENTGGSVFPGLFGHYDEMLEALCAVEPDTIHAKLFPRDQVVMDFIPLAPGTYDMVCTIARHKERGMKGEVRVLDPAGGVGTFSHGGNDQG